MSRRYQPDGTLMMSALAGRIDVLEQITQKTSTDVAALGRGLGDLTAQIRRLTDTTTSTGISRAGAQTPTAGPAPTTADEVDQPQWDWFAVDDAQTASELLAAVIVFTEQVLTYYGLRLVVACWPLHPTVMGDLLALMAERDTAYAGTTPTPVSEWLTRWLPAGLDRITRALTDCVAERGHRHAGRTYDLTGFDPYSVPAWWATDRTTNPVEAFSLTPLT